MSGPLTKEQAAFLRDGEEGIFCDKRIARALCARGLMGVAGYVIGETVYAFTERGLKMRADLRAEAGLSA